MSDTISVFKVKQQEAEQLLQKLVEFIEKGREFGLKPDSGLMHKLDTALKASNSSVLKVALIGGFSEGKTSIASAWLERLDGSMNISQQESSNEVVVYQLGDDIELIDTPGLFGFKEQETSTGEIEKYKESTRRYVSEAHLVLYVMNSTNPIKDSHADDLKWLFRELDLLPRTVFVLSRFDEVADVEDDWSYREALKIKQENVIGRLRDMISLTDDEAAQINIVGVAANPFGEGTDYWLKNLEEFKAVSRIGTLQQATRETIDKNGGLNPIVLQAQKSMIQDVLIKQIPVVREAQETLDNELIKLADTTEYLNDDIAPLETRIANVRVGLIEFVREHFSLVLRQVKGSDLTTFSDVYENEIGEDGDILSSKIEQEFFRQSQSVSSSLQRINCDFDNEMIRFESSVGSDLFNKGLGMISKTKINNTQVLAARDGLVATGKMVGLDLAKYLKFKPWGAVNAAAKANVALAAAGILLEMWDSYKKAEEEKRFQEMKIKTISTLEDQRKGLLEYLSGDGFVAQHFPSYGELCVKFEQILAAKEQTSSRKQAFDQWRQEGRVIEAEYSVL
ncbi:LeoA/HP0731 family dynamin-like GTPase [Pseudomonas sp. FME51]|uniref:LeoA/HP0731 family dynamin-like GTPase n=1 Tax=Pseudomonas sp. FME51 TaxID=2742609 RepID=UPI001867359B|nr:LeoA/HP0731 family dynamin-like GTPase [Pseudomonas sp. FME51]